MACQTPLSLPHLFAKIGLGSSSLIISVSDVYVLPLVTSLLCFLSTFSAPKGGLDGVLETRVQNAGRSGVSRLPGPGLRLGKAWFGEGIPESPISPVSYETQRRVFFRGPRKQLRRETVLFSLLSFQTFEDQSGRSWAFRVGPWRVREGLRGGVVRHPTGSCARDSSRA